MVDEAPPARRATRACVQPRPRPEPRHYPKPADEAEERRRRVAAFAAGTGLAEIRQDRVGRPDPELKRLA